MRIKSEKALLSEMVLRVFFSCGSSSSGGVPPGGTTPRPTKVPGKTHLLYDPYSEFLARVPSKVIDKSAEPKPSASDSLTGLGVSFFYLSRRAFHARHPNQHHGCDRKKFPSTPGTPRFKLNRPRRERRVTAALKLLARLIPSSYGPSHPTPLRSPSLCIPEAETAPPFSASRRVKTRVDPRGRWG